MATTIRDRTAVSEPSARRGAGPRAQVSELQRARILAAATAAVEEMGYARLTVAQVIGRARVSRKTFYDLFRDREDCFLAVFEQAVERARASIAEAYLRERSWREAVRAALVQTLRLMDSEPGVARLCVVESLAAGERVLARRDELAAQIAGALDRGRAGGGPELPELAGEGVVGAVAAIVHARLRTHPGEQLARLEAPLMAIIVLPYLGPRAAATELRREPASAGDNGRADQQNGGLRSEDPLRGLQMRLTHRTVTVLEVVAAHPGASNREIAARAGIGDQGQMSKLLARLARLGLAVNRGEGQERGGANAWFLTPRGEGVERATRPG